MARRVVDEIGDSHLPGTRFTYDARELLRATREIESSVRGGGSLWAGFQNAAKLDHEADRHADLTPSLLDRVRGNTLAGFREALSVPVAVADRGGISVDANVPVG